MTKIEEIWKDLIGYNGQYKISNLGKVVSVNRMIWNHLRFVPRSGKTLKHILLKGYPAVRVSSGGKTKTPYVHRIIADHFIPNPLSKPEVNHINGNKLDYSLSNLEWCTHKENCIHAHTTGLCDSRGECSGRAKYTLKQILNLKRCNLTNLKELCIKYSVSVEYAREIRGGRRWAHITDHPAESIAEGYSISRTKTEQP